MNQPESMYQSYNILIACLISITCWVNKSQQMSAEQESQYIQYHYGMLTLTLGEAQRLLYDCYEPDIRSEPCT